MPCLDWTHRCYQLESVSERSYSSGFETMPKAASDSKSSNARRRGVRRSVSPTGGRGRGRGRDQTEGKGRGAAKGSRKKGGKKMSKKEKKRLRAERKQRIKEQKALNLTNEKELRDAAAAGDVVRVATALAAFGQLDVPPGDVNQFDNFGMTALLSASLRGHRKIVQMLIRGNVGEEDFEYTDEESGERKIDTRPIRWANSDVNRKSNGGGATAVMWACERGHEQIVRDLMQAGADSDIRNDYGWTALMYAALNGHGKCIRALFEGPQKEESLEKIDYRHANSGNTALMWAASKGQVGSLTVLLELGACPYEKNGSQLSPMQLAEMNEHEELMQALHNWDEQKAQERAEAIDKVATYGKEFATSQGMDLESLDSCWHRCPEGECTCLLLHHVVPPTPEELEAQRLAEEAEAEAKRLAEEAAAAKEERRGRRGRGRGRRNRGRSPEGKQRSVSPSRRDRSKRK